MKNPILFLFLLLIAIPARSTNPQPVWVDTLGLYLESVCFHPNSQYIAASGIDYDTRETLILDLEGKTIRQYHDMSAPGFSGSGKYLVGLKGDIFGDRRLIVYDFETDTLILNIYSQIYAFDISPDEHYIATGWWNAITIRDLKTGDTIKTIKNLGTDIHKQPYEIFKLKYTPDGSHLVFSIINVDAQIVYLEFIDLTTDSVDYVVNINIEFAFSKDSTKIAFEQLTHPFPSIAIMDMATKQIIMKTDSIEYRGNFNGITFFDNDRYIYASNQNVDAEIFELSTGQRVGIVPIIPAGGYFKASDASNDDVYLVGGASGFLFLYRADDYVSVEDPQPEIRTTLYPNPTTNIVNLTKSASNIDIIDNTGRIVKSIRGETQTINTSDLPAGSYFLRTQSGKQNVTYKLIINR